MTDMTTDATTGTKIAMNASMSASMNNTTRDTALAGVSEHFDSGAFLRDLARRVAIRTASQDADSGPALHSYLADEMAPSLASLGFSHQIFPNPDGVHGPFLIATRHESDTLPTVLVYGHGDVTRGQDRSWTQGRGPWTVAVDGAGDNERWCGRGTADNKGQHSINVAALAQVLAARGGHLGFNVKVLLEMGEEAGSPGLAEFCSAHAAELKSDVLIASDGPRLRRDRPTVFLGSRGVANFDLTLTLREGGHHSGNWGGLLRNPGTVLANAIASMVDANGKILVETLRPPPIPANVNAALADLQFGGDPGDPEVDATWGEPGLTPGERVIAWNTLEVLAYKTGNPDFPVNAWVRCCPTWAAACPTACSPTSWACPRCGCRAATPPAASTRRMNTLPAAAEEDHKSQPHPHKRRFDRETPMRGGCRPHR